MTSSVDAIGAYGRPSAIAALFKATASAGCHPDDHDGILRRSLGRVNVSWAPDLRFHDLRHEAGSRKLEAGYPMHAVSLWLGHTDLTTTARYLNADVGQLHALNDRLVPAAVRATA